MAELRNLEKLPIVSPRILGDAGISQFSNKRKAPEEYPSYVPAIRPPVQYAGDEILLELGCKIEDQRGSMRWLGSSSGVFFVEKALQEARDKYEDVKVASIDELCGLDSGALQDIASSDSDAAPTPTSLPNRDDVQPVIKAFFDHTAGRFPVLHQQSFLDQVDDIYGDSDNQTSRDVLPLFYLVLAVGWGYKFPGSLKKPSSARTALEYLKLAKGLQHKIFYTTDDRFIYLQALTIEALLYFQLGEQSYASRTSGEASMLGLELGLHRSTRRFTYGPLKSELRKRVFWCIFLLDV